ncbi:MAG: hypothetical protein HY791_19215 [Deltaproteobacteria bacterium]|nr:hypothetical protein [Deltaproteobacteria bacterium]
MNERFYRASLLSLLAACADSNGPELTVEPTTPSAGSESRAGPPIAFAASGLFGIEDFVPGTGFEAMGFYDNLTENGSLFIPPDPNGAAGTDSLLAVVNAMIELRTKGGGLIARESLGGFFTSLTPVNALFDPKVVWDHHANRFLAVALEVVDDGVSPNASRILVAVSKTASPSLLTTADWWYHAIDSRMTIDGFDTWADYPGFEVDEEAVYITNNMFEFGTGIYVSGRLWIIGKTAFYSGGAAVVSVNDPFTPVGAIRTTTMPALVMDLAGLGGTQGTYLVAYSGLSGGGLEFLQVIRVDDPLGTPTFVSAGAGAGNFVALGNVDDTTLASADAPQSGTATLIDAGDRRAYDAVWRNDKLWMVTTMLPPAGADVGEMTAHWVSMDTTVGDEVVLLQQGDISGDTDIAANTHTYYPSIAVNSSEAVQIGFAASASTIFAGAYYAGREAVDTAGTLQAAATVHVGVDFYVREFGAGRNRWGDYSGMALDPNDDTLFWAYNEWADVADTTPDFDGGTGVWGTAWRPTAVGPALAVELSDLEGAVTRRGVELRWNASFEQNHLGYHVWRARGAEPPERLTKELILGSSLVTRQRLLAGYSYGWVDPKGDSRSRYWVESFDLEGHSTKHDVVMRARPFPMNNPQSLARALALRTTQPSLDGRAQTKLQYESGWSVAGRPAIKLGVSSSGLTAVDAKSLFAAGLPTEVAPSALRLYVDGQEVAMRVLGEGAGLVEGIEFFGVGLDVPSTDTHVYWLVWDQPGTAKRMTRVRSDAEHGSPFSFEDVAEIRERNVWFAGLARSEERFFGPALAGEVVERTFALDVVDPSKSATLEVAIQGVSRDSHRIDVYLNDRLLGTVTAENRQRGVSTLRVPEGSLVDGRNQLRLARKESNSDVSLLDYARLRYTRVSKTNRPELFAEAPAGLRLAVEGMAEGARLFDVTDPRSVEELVAPKLSFRLSRPATVYATARPRQPAFILPNRPSAWVSARGADALVLTSRSLRPAAEKLARHRQTETGMTVAVVDVEDVFDEFGYGHPSPFALRRFLQSTRAWEQAPQYVTLFGDATLDPRDFLGLGKVNHVPTTYVDLGDGPFASDEALADFDADGAADVMIGRVPAANADDAEALVSKLIAAGPLNLRSAVVVSQDDGSGYLPQWADQVTSILSSSIEVERIKSSSGLPQASSLEARLDQGADLVAYFGHGGPDRWAGDLFDTSRARTLSGSPGLYVSMSCLNGTFDDPALTSLGESVLLAPGGATAVIAMSTAAKAPVQRLGATELFGALSEGQATLGEIVHRARLASPPEVRSGLALLGDPMTQVVAH